LITRSKSSKSPSRERADYMQIPKLGRNRSPTFFMVYRQDSVTGIWNLDGMFFSRAEAERYIVGQKEKKMFKIVKEKPQEQDAA